MESQPGKSAIFSPKNLIFVVIVLALAAGAFFLLQLRHNRPLVSTEEKQTIASVPVTKVISKTLFREDQLPGEINAYQDVLIYPKVPGFIKWLGVDRGSIVKQGQLMVKMYAPEYLARRTEAQAKVAAIKAALSAEESRLSDLQAELKKHAAPG